MCLSAKSAREVDFVPVKEKDALSVVLKMFLVAFIMAERLVNAQLVAVKVSFNTRPLLRPACCIF